MKFVNVYESDGETTAGCVWDTRAKAEKAGKDGLPGHRRMVLAKMKEPPASGLRRPKWDDMGANGNEPS